MHTLVLEKDTLSILFSFSRYFHLSIKHCILSNPYHREQEFALFEFVMQ